MSDELDVYPFCGAQPLLNEIAPHSHNLTIGGVKFPDHPGSWTIECPACECGMIADTRGAVTAAWNRRAQRADEVQHDTNLLNFIEENPQLSLRFHKKRWAFVGMTNYECDVFKTAREAIAAAMAKATP